MPNEKLIFEVTFNTKIGQAQLKALGDEGAKANKKLKDGAGDASKGMGGLGNVITAVAGAAVIGKLIGGIKACASAYMEEEKASQMQVQALKNLGIYTPQYAEQLKAQARELQRNTTFADENIMAFQTLALQMGILPKDLDRVTKAAADMSAATGMDMDAALKKINMGSMGAGRGLKMYGIEVDKTGTKNEKLAGILDDVNKKFGGAAEAAAKTTLSGGIENLKNKLGDLKETIGAELAPAIIFWAEKIGKVVDDLSDMSGAHLTTYQKEAKAVSAEAERLQHMADTLMGKGSAGVIEKAEILARFTLEFGGNIENLATALKEAQEREAGEAAYTIRAKPKQDAAKAALALEAEKARLAAEADKLREEAAEKALQERLEAEKKALEERLKMQAEYHKRLTQEAITGAATRTEAEDRRRLSMFGEYKPEAGKLALTAPTPTGFGAGVATGIGKAEKEKADAEALEKAIEQLKNYQSKFNEVSGVIKDSLGDSISQGILTGELSFKGAVDRMKEYFVKQLVMGAVGKFVNMFLGAATGGGSGLLSGVLGMFGIKAAGDIVISPKHGVFETAPGDAIIAYDERARGGRTAGAPARGGEGIFAPIDPLNPRKIPRWQLGTDIPGAQPVNSRRGGASIPQGANITINFSGHVFGATKEQIAIEIAKEIGKATAANNI